MGRIYGAGFEGEEVSEWIKFSEKKPEYEKIVLGLDKKGHMELFYMTHDFHWGIYQDVCFIQGLNPFTPVFWMDIPELPVGMRRKK